MLTLTTLLPAMAPNPVEEGSLRPGLDPSQVTPGMIGFLMSLLLAAAVILLVLDFNRRSRRLRYRAEYAERRAAGEKVGEKVGEQAGEQAAEESGEQADGDRPGAPAETGAPEGSVPAESPVSAQDPVPAEDPGQHLPGPEAPGSGAAAQQPVPPADGDPARRG